LANERNRFFLLIVILIAICLCATGFSMWFLYKTALDEERGRLTETAQSQARLIESVSRFDETYRKGVPEGAVAATLEQIKDAHKHYKGFGKTGEFTLAVKKGDNIVFLLSHRHYDLNNPKPVPFDSKLAEPMRLALSGKSGTIIGPDYRGEEVLAAYEPVKGLGLGIVAKIDMDEIKAPFVHTAKIVIGVTILLISLGAALFLRISNPIVRRLEEQNKDLNKKIKEREQSEETLRESEGFLKILLNAIPIPVFYKDRNGRYLGFNRPFEVFFGLTAEELVGKTVLDVHPPELAAIYQTKDNELFENGGTQQYEFQVKNAHGVLRHVIFNKAAFTDNQGNINGLIGAIIDITEDKQNEIELRNREQLLNEIGHIAKIGGWEHDLVTGEATWTRETYKIVEIDESDSIPGPDEHLNYYLPEDRLILEEAYHRAMDTGKQFDLELRCTTAKGKPIWARAIGRPEFKDGKCVKMKGTFQDITERKKMEEHLQQIEKLDSIGRLAGGVAHDFNNMLGVIIGYGEDLLEMLNTEDPLWESAKEIVKAGKRSAALTRQLLAFSRKQTLQPEVLNLNNLVGNIENMLRRLIGEDIDLTIHLSEEPYRVKVDPGQIEQVIMNLAVNAREAMPQGGKLTIETANVELDEQYVEDHVSVSPGNYVMLSITDNGCGMSEESRAKVFEPFFTTKDKGKGTGLGLSTVFGIVKQSGGNIWVYSEPGHGTSFKIYLPQTTEALSEKKAPKGNATIEGQREVVLVVEDEPSLRKLCAAILKGLNYKVILAENGGEALLLVEEKKVRPDLIITDVVMPEMSGKVLADRLKNSLSDLKVIYMSGYTDNAIVHHGVLDSGVPFIQKPFTRDSLGKIVREILDEGKR
jgi:PAS domain S-box-containing protein